MGRKLRPNVYETTCTQLSPTPVIAKLARFPWEVALLAAETAAYEWIKGHEIDLAFFGHLTEEGRTIGFLVARIGDGAGSGVRHASEDDLPLCRAVLQKLHSMSIKHGDTNILTKICRMVSIPSLRLFPCCWINRQ